MDPVKPAFWKLRDALLAFGDLRAQPLDLTGRLLQRQHSRVALLARIGRKRRNRFQTAKLLTQFLQGGDVRLVACDSSQRHELMVQRLALRSKFIVLLLGVLEFRLLLLYLRGRNREPLYLRPRILVLLESKANHSALGFGRE